MAQFAFVQVPQLRFDLRVLGGNILNIAFVENWLRDVFCSLVEPYTLPDKACRSPHPRQSPLPAHLIRPPDMRLYHRQLWLQLINYATPQVPQERLSCRSC